MTRPPPLRPLTAFHCGPGPHPATASASLQIDGTVSLAIHIPAAHPDRLKLAARILQLLNVRPEPLQ